MTNPQLLDYVQKSLANGNSVEQIRSTLLQQGWGNDEVNQVFAGINSEQNLQVPQPAIMPKKSLTPKILVGLAVLLVLGGAGYFVFSQNKNQVSDKSFENGTETLNRIAAAFKDVKSFEINGNFNVKVRMEEAKSNF